MNKMQKARDFFSKQAAKLGLVGAAAIAYVENAMAALPTEATAAFSTISGNVTDVLAAMWPIVALATSGFVLVKLFKRGANKAV